MRTEPVIIHDESGFAGMRAAGRLAASVLDMIAPHVVAGTTTGDLDRICHDFIEAHGAVPAPLNYKGSRRPPAFRLTMLSATAFRARRQSATATF